MLADQRDLIKKYQFEAENWSERARLLLRENLDLKSLLEQHGIVISNDLIRHELFESEVSADE